MLNGDRKNGGGNYDVTFAKQNNNIMKIKRKK